MSYNGWQIQNRIEQYLGRYEYIDDGSSKFWECLRDGDNPGKFATRWGAIKLTKTKHNTKGDMSADQAAAKIAEKLNKGYRLVQNSNDVMAARFAQEDAVALHKELAKPPKGKKKVVEEVVVQEAPRVAPRRL